MKDIHEDSVVHITLLSFIEKEHRTDNANATNGPI
jgi:hypothetical protein